MNIAVYNSQKILENIGDGLIYVDRQGKIVFVNKVVEELTGWRVEECLGTKIEEVFRIKNHITNEFLDDYCYEVMDSKIRSGLKRNTVLVQKDKSERFVSATISMVQDEENQPTGIVILFRDVSQHRDIEDKLENGQKNFKIIFDTAPVGMLVVNECIIIKTLNHSLLKIIGKEYDKVIGKRIGEGLGCVNSITNGGCGLSERCRFCKLSEHLTNIIEKDEVCLGIEFQYKLLVDNRVLSKWLRINMEKMILEGRTSYLLVIDDISQYKQLEETILRSKDFYISLFDNFPALIWRTGLDAKCDYFNKNWLEFTGRTMEQEAGDGWTKGAHSEDVEMRFRIFSEAFAAREPFEMAYRLMNRDGEFRWINDIGRPFYDIDGKFAGYVGACFDITERKIAEEGLRRYQLLSENANDIILFADINGDVIEANDAAIRAYGYEKEELLSKSIFYLINPDTRSPVGAQPYQSNARGIYYEATAYRKDGSTFTAEVSMQGTEIGSSKVLMAILRDVTERKRINEELKQAKESAEAANHAKSEFLANMSHEIRTPLNGMIGMIDLTLLTGLTQEQKDNLGTAKECVGTLLNLINDILDFSKIEARKLTIEHVAFNIEDLLAQTVKPHVISAQGKGLLLRHIFDSETSKVVNGDPYRLKQVLNNLVGNAVKFTESGEVDVSIKSISKSNEQTELEFRISDTGIGIAAEDIDSLFNSFSQVDTTHTRKYGGTGLGLAISKQLVEIMGGSIWVKSIKGSGSTFCFTVKLGIGKMSSCIVKTVVPVIKTEHPLKILLVEDDRINQLVITRMLKEIGHKVVSANNGKEALLILDGEIFNVILMDIQMPEMDGIETTKRIRGREEITGDHIPIIALTAYALQGDRDKFLSIGMDGYISKPIQINSFLDTLEKISDGLLKPQAAGTTYKFEIDNGEDEYGIKEFKTEYSESIESILKNIEVNIKQLKYAFERKDLSSVERYAHVVKKLSLEISAHSLKTAAFKVELASRRGNIMEAEEHYNLIMGEFLKYKEQIESFKQNSLGE